MSRLYFHTKEATAELMGTEAHWLRSIAFDAGYAPLRHMSDDFARRLYSLLPAAHWMRARPFDRSSHFEQQYQTALVGEPVEFDGKTITSFALVLNTAITLGSDVVKLATRLHAQCEIHGWIAGRNRAWLADLIDSGLDSGILRRTIQRETGPDASKIPQGWDEVTALLRSTDEGPVVLSYSVTEWFPDPYVAGRIGKDDPDADYEAWAALDPAEQWDISFAALTSDRGGPRIGPDNLDGRFDHGLSLLDLRADDWENRVRKALATWTP